MGVGRKLFLVSLPALMVGIYIGPERIGQYYTWASTDPDFLRIPACIGLNCPANMATCLTNSACSATLDCITECSLTQPRNKQAMCAYICEVTDGYLNPEFESLMLCMIENNCMSHYPQDGACMAREEDGVEELTSLDMVAGDWWAIRGLNCGLTEEWPGGYDGFPCQHERWLQREDTGQWQNSISFCAGADNSCVSRGGGAGIRTVANASLARPGVITHSYDSALAPQIEKWIVVSAPSPDYMLVYWCGNIPIQNPEVITQAYNGGLLLSRFRNDANMPDPVREELRHSAKKFGLDFDKMCPSDNSWCPS